MSVQIGQRVKAVRMAKDSFYRQVIGTVTAIRNGYAQIEADTVMDRWSDSFERHPGTCSTAALLSDVVAA